MATVEVVIPDFGDVQEITVVEVYVAVGDEVAVEDALIALESEKAVMDIPSSAAGVIKEIRLQEDDKVSSGDVIVVVESTDSKQAAGQTAKREESEFHDKQLQVEKVPEQPTEKLDADKQAEQKAEKKDVPEKSLPTETKYHATPSVRGYARELGVDLANIAATGPKGRILKDDVINFVKDAMKGTPVGVPADFFTTASVSLEDLSKYGEVERVPLNRIKKVSGAHLHKSWVTIPHVTHFDETDVTDLEEFRKLMNEEVEGLRFSPLVFIIKAVVAALKQFPLFNSSLDLQSNSVVLKHFFNIGIAVDTSEGLVVPVIKNADRKGMREIARDISELSQSAREGKLAIADMQGAGFTISSLGGIGGTGFTPIINSPQVAILGLSRNYLKPVWDVKKQSFTPRLILPFSLSYDHRVIDGADAARFCRTLGRDIGDLRRVLL